MYNILYVQCTCHTDRAKELWSLVIPPSDWLCGPMRWPPVRLSLGAGRNGKNQKSGRLVLQATNYLRKASGRATSKGFIKPPSSILEPPKPPPMASRRLALNLSQGLRSRAGLSATGLLRRGFATPSSVGKTQTTTLKNGLTVRTIRPGSIGLEIYPVT